MVRSEIRRNFYSHRSIDPWNRLPSDIKHSPNTKIFKSRLIKWMDYRCGRKYYGNRFLQFTPGGDDEKNCFKFTRN